MKFWRMTGLIAASPVDIILDRGNFTLDELLDEEDLIPEYRTRNARLINYLRNRTQVEQLIRYIVEEAPEGADEKQIFKFPFIACELFICEVDVILNTVADEEELMDMLFSFLKPDHSHNPLLAGYFGKVVMCLMVQKTSTVVNHIQSHQEIIRQLVDLVGITSIMEVLIRLIGAEEDIYGSYIDDMEWLKDTDVLEMIVDKFSSSDSPEVHANAAEVLCATIRYAPPGIAAKFCSSSFMGNLFRHALDGSRPKSVLVHSLTVCISLLDPNRLVSASYNLFRSQLTHGSLIAANPETIDLMLRSLGDLMKLLDVSSAPVFFPTTYGYLKPPFGKHRLKIVEFISVLLTIGSGAAERELVQQGAIKHTVNMFFEYPFNNFLHRSVENIVKLCLESQSAVLIEHLLDECDLVNKILEAENQPLLLADCSKPTIGRRGKLPPRTGNFGHMTRIANKIVQSANSNNLVQTHLQENKAWVTWHTNVLVKRNAVENVHRWACGRPNMLLDQLTDNYYEGFRNTDFDVVALANSLNSPSGIEGNAEVTVSGEPVDEDAKFDKESAEVKPSLHLCEDPENISLFTCSSSPFHGNDGVGENNSAHHLSMEAPTSDLSREATGDENDVMTDSRFIQGSDSDAKAEEAGGSIVENDPITASDDLKPSSPVNHCEEPAGSIEWRDLSTSNEMPDSDPTVSSPIYEAQADEDLLDVNGTNVEENKEDYKDAESDDSSADASTEDSKTSPAPESGSQDADTTDESISITTDSNAPLDGEKDSTIATLVVSENAKHEERKPMEN